TGAGRGLGRATALLFARAGADVVTVDVDRAAAKETAEQVEALGRRSAALAADLAEPAAGAGAVAEAARRFGRLGVPAQAAAALAGHQITRNPIARGRMETPMTERLDRSIATLTGREYTELHAERARAIPLGRRAEPEEVAEAALWLAGPAARYVTGCRLN